MKTALALAVAALATWLCACEVIDDPSVFHVVGEDGATLSDGARPSKDTLFGDASALPSIDGATGDDLSAVVDAASLETDLVMPDLVMPDLVMPDLLLAISPSCVGLAKSCGPQQSDDCCASPLVPGGTYNRSNNVNYPATVSDFRLDKYEVTVGRFRQFVNAGYGTQGKPPANGSGANHMMGTGWDGANWNGQLVADTNALKSAVKCDQTYQTWTDNAGANENLPMNCIDWFEAFAFCAWDGGRLPTEAEWNFAAAGGSEQRPYPWSMNMNDMTIDDSYAVYNGNGPGVRNVGSRSPKGDAKWGQTDLAGNVWEWNFDWWANIYPQPCIDCSNLHEASNRWVRGGSFNAGASDLLSSNRGNDDRPSTRYNSLGARCARTP